jgi:hypothetical protein
MNTQKNNTKFMESDLAPIVLFVYKRPLHTGKTLRALKNNVLADKSLLYIFADGPNEHSDDTEREAISETRKVIKSEQWCGNIVIYESDSNKGLAISVIEGVTKITKKHGKIIVLEDDIITSPSFLLFMNNALSFYQNESKVWHITGYSIPISKENIADTFFTKYMACWGWATWSDRWQYFQKNPAELVAMFTKDMKKEFNYGKSNYFFRQIESNRLGNDNTWAVFWGTTIYLHDGLCINPKRSFTQNIGFDGTGNHPVFETGYDVFLNGRYPVTFETDIRELKMMRKRLSRHFRHFSKYDSILYSLFGNLKNVKKRIKRDGFIISVNYYYEKYILRNRR